MFACMFAYKIDCILVVNFGCPVAAQWFSSMAYSNPLYLMRTSIWMDGSPFFHVAGNGGAYTRTFLKCKNERNTLVLLHPASTHCLLRCP